MDGVHVLLGRISGRERPILETAQERDSSPNSARITIRNQKSKPGGNMIDDIVLFLGCEIFDVGLVRGVSYTMRTFSSSRRAGSGPDQEPQGRDVS